MTEAELRAKLDALHSDVIRIKTCLLGVPDSNDDGLMGKVNRLDCEHGRLKRQFWMLVALLIGAGVLGGSIIGVIK